jgi:kinesin family protein 18/19
MAGTPDSHGIMYLILKDLFAKILLDTEKDYDIKVSYVEIYNENIRDLLIPPTRENHFLDLRDDPERGVCIAGVTEF